MTLQEVFDQLGYGELSQLSIGGNDPGIIDDNNYEQVISHINLGLTSLFKRFNLKQGRVVVRLIEGKTSYKLHSDYSIQGTVVPEADRYLEDTVYEPFQDDLLKVEKVLTDLGVEFPLNDAGNVYSILTPSTKVLRLPDGFPDLMPDALKTETLEVHYRANHPKLSTEPSLQVRPWDIELELPDAYLEALLYFVASRVHNPIGMSEEFHAGNSYAAKYEQACQWLEAQNLEVDRGASTTKLRDNGWA